MFDNAIDDRVHLHAPAQELLERRDAAAEQAAGYDRAEVREIGVHVEGKAVRSDPARDVDAHRHQLVVADPDARGARDAARLDAEVARHADEHFLERPHVPAEVAPVLGQIENRIAYELAGTVIRDVAAAIRFEEL